METGMKSFEREFTRLCNRRPRRRIERRWPHAAALRELCRRTRSHERSSACFAIPPAVAYVVVRALVTNWATQEREVT